MRSVFKSSTPTTSKLIVAIHANLKKAIPSGLFRLGSPVSSRQQGELSIVIGIDVASIVWFMSRIEHYLHENTADGMHGLMAIEPFVHQPLECLGRRRCFAQCNLVFDHHMGHCMKLRVFELHPDATMVINHQVDSFRFVEFEPNLWIGLLNCVVLHGKFSYCSPPGNYKKIRTIASPLSTSEN
jgi:hypothetical protein